MSSKIPSHSDLNYYLRRGRLERAKVATAFANAVVRAGNRWATRLSEALARRRLRRETVQQLRGLSDRTLQDIGIPRSQIWTVADQLVNTPGTVTSRSVHRQLEAAGSKRTAQSPANQNRPSNHHPAPVRVAAGCG